MAVISVARTSREIEDAVKSVVAQFPEDIVYIRHSLHGDWTDEPALFFRVLLNDRFDPKVIARDRVSREAFMGTINSIMAAIRNAFQPEGLMNYFNFRTASEQSELRDPKWE
jgi:hypothetical protein